MLTGAVVALFGLMAASLGVSGESKPKGYLAEPKAGHGRGVLVLHAWWGLNDDVKKFCDKLAENGFTAFAPDLFEGKTATSRDKAQSLVDAYESHHEDLERQITEAGKFLAAQTGHAKIGVVGFSFGAYYALHASNADSERVRACVVFYGTGQQDFGSAKADYLGHFAEKDEFEPKEGVDHLTDLLHDAGRPATFYTYPGTGHWFFEPGVKGAFNADAAGLAWNRTIDFLRKTLN